MSSGANWLDILPLRMSGSKNSEVNISTLALPCWEGRWQHMHPVTSYSTAIKLPNMQQFAGAQFTGRHIICVQIYAVQIKGYLYQIYCTGPMYFSRKYLLVTLPELCLTQE